MSRLLVGVLFFASFAAAAPFPSLYFFGDGLTDTGNTYEATSRLNRFTLGVVPIVPAAPYYEGRFSNGPVWAEHTAWALGRLEDAAPAGVSLGIFGDVDGPGNNYAVGGAQTDSGGALGSFDALLPTGIATQVDFYLGEHEATADPEALYFLAAGGNDLRNAARMSNPVLRRAAAEQAAGNVLTSAVRLYSAGARHLMLLNAPNIGMIPESLGDGLTEEGLDASWHFNSSLAWHMNFLRTLPGLSADYFDLFELHNRVVADFGWDAVQPCRDGPPQRCEETLFFDSVHPTAEMHARIGYAVADQVLSAIEVRQGRDAALGSALELTAVPEPGAAGLVLSGAILFGVYRCRRYFGMHATR